MSPMELRRSELYAHIADVVTDTARQLGIDVDQADHLAAAVVDSIAEDVGGQVLSFPKDAAYKLSKRELEILDRHRKGATLAQLSRDYNLGERGLRKLLKRAELRNPDLNQPSLFGT